MRRQNRHYTRQAHVSAPTAAITRFCRKWRIVKLAMFGSVLTDQFRDDSDIDMLATFQPDTRHTLLDLVQMERDLGAIYGRRVDLGEYEALLLDRNDLRREDILNTMQVIYEER